MLQRAKASLVIAAIAVSLVVLPAAALPGSEERAQEGSWAPLALGLDLFGEWADVLVQLLEKAGSVMIADGTPTNGTGASTSANGATTPELSAGN
ncbi:MAG TPA: hypothetical protein VF017_00475 [Thermoanaerobaculia bacterium]|nr:hypothetical protein [Thermoanaerobaculia bacterium]